jgi:hypothetical protein
MPTFVLHLMHLNSHEWLTWNELNWWRRILVVFFEVDIIIGIYCIIRVLGRCVRYVL